MDRLADMGTFPWTVHLGASVNILFTIWLTFVVHHAVAGKTIALIFFGMGMVALNVLPVFLLRKYFMPADTTYPLTHEMNFIRDQHKFSSWVYAIASANMFFWIVAGWCVFDISESSVALVLLQIVAFVVTYVPLWRGFLLR